MQSPASASRPPTRAASPSPATASPSSPCECASPAVGTARRPFPRAVRSEVHLTPYGETRPVIRYEYEAGSARSLPSAHVHVHTDDPRVVALLADSGTRTVRARRNADRAAKGKAQTADLHLPLGGSRFRPALEDVLHMVVYEFGVDAEDGWQHHLANGREGWRRIQTRAVVRDAPGEAVAALRALGYEVSPPAAGAPDDNRARLRET